LLIGYFIIADHRIISLIDPLQALIRTDDPRFVEEPGVQDDAARPGDQTAEAIRPDGAQTKGVLTDGLAIGITDHAIDFTALDQLAAVIKPESDPFIIAGSYFLNSDIQIGVASIEVDQEKPPGQECIARCLGDLTI